MWNLIEVTKPFIISFESHGISNSWKTVTKELYKLRVNHLHLALLSSKPIPQRKHCKEYPQLCIAITLNMPATNAYCHTNPMTFTCYINTFMILQNQMRILKKMCMPWFSTEHADDFICEFTLQKSSHSYYKQKKPNNQSYIFYYFLINIFYRQWLQVSYPPPSNPWRLLSQYVCQNLVCILKVNRWKFFPHTSTCKHMLLIYIYQVCYTWQSLLICRNVTAAFPMHCQMSARDRRLRKKSIRQCTLWWKTTLNT